MNYIDITILAFVGFFVIKGLFRGFFREVFGLVGLLAALILATKYMSGVTVWFNQVLRVPPTPATVLGFLVIFFGVIFLFQLLIHFFQKIFKYSMLAWLEKLAGAGVGFLKGATIVSLLFLFLSLLPFGNQFLPGLNDSRLHKPARSFAPKLFDLMMEAIPDSKSFGAELKESFDNFSSAEIARNTQKFLKSFQSNHQLQEVPSNNNDQSH